MQELDLKVLLGTVFALNKVKLFCCLVCSSTGAVIFAPNRERERLVQSYLRQRERERERERCSQSFASTHFLFSFVGVVWWMNHNS
jgi:hypothetical protein